MCLHQFLLWSAYSCVSKKLIVLLMSLHFLPFYFFEKCSIQEIIVSMVLCSLLHGFMSSTISLFVRKASL
jgi:hypothetical protein